MGLNFQLWQCFSLFTQDAFIRLKTRIILVLLLCKSSILFRYRVYVYTWKVTREKISITYVIIFLLGKKVKEKSLLLATYVLKLKNVFIGPFNHLAKKISRILQRTEVSSTCKTFSFTFFNLNLLILSHTSHLICIIYNSVQDAFKRNKFLCGWTWLTWSNT